VATTEFNERSVFHQLNRETRQLSKTWCHLTQINYQNTTAMMTVYILAVQQNDIFLQSCISFSPPPQVCLAHATADFTVYVTLFNDFVFTNFVTLVIFFRSRMGFYCYTDICITTEFITVKRFYVMYIVNWWGSQKYVILLSISLLQHSL
jgi:hypothetical protein